MDLHANARRLAGQILVGSQPDSHVLNKALRLLAKYRHQVITTALVKTYGTDVLGGPFQGMHFVAQGTHGSHAPMLLGCYESDLHPFVLSLPARGYDTILNIGSAEGYYAVGLKRMMPDVAVHAFDTDPNAQRTTRQVAALNGVEVFVGGLFRGEDLEGFRGRRTLLICDIEGGEIELLDPERFPALTEMDVLVELHRTPKGNAADIVPPRFAATHTVTHVTQGINAVPLPDLLTKSGHLDALLAIWEWREAPTPWAILERRTDGASASP